jgi:SAM-dependent methyltransferase
LYNGLASEYENGFYDQPHRTAYDRLAWEYVQRRLPAEPDVVIDVGCGGGRWVDRLLPLAQRVIGIEPAPEMIKVLERKMYGPSFSLISEPMETVSIEADTADVVLAMGSLQYSQAPAQMLHRFASWARPGGIVFVLADSYMALVLELLSARNVDEALERATTRMGVWKHNGQEAELHLFDRNTLETYFRNAGLIDVVSRGLLVTATAWGITECKKAATCDETSLLRLERKLAEIPAMADAGKQIIATGRKPAISRC